MYLTKWIHTDCRLSSSLQSGLTISLCRTYVMLGCRYLALPLAGKTWGDDLRQDTPSLLGLFVWLDFHMGYAVISHLVGQPAGLAIYARLALLICSRPPGFACCYLLIDLRSWGVSPVSRNRGNIVSLMPVLSASEAVPPVPEQKNRCLWMVIRLPGGHRVLLHPHTKSRRGPA
jgi:hypothetical protein